MEYLREKKNQHLVFFFAVKRANKIYGVRDQINSMIELQDQHKIIINRFVVIKILARTISVSIVFLNKI
jgi:hypothetical protein